MSIASTSTYSRLERLVSPSRPSATLWRVLGRGALFGLAWALPFRLLMRLVSDDHVFTLAGSVAIALYSALLFASASATLEAHRRGWGWRRRAIPATPFLLLLSGFFIFVPPYPLLLAAAYLGFRARSRAVRTAILAVDGVLFVASWILVLIVMPASYDNVVAEFAMVVPLSLALSVPLVYALGFVVRPLPLPAARPAVRTAPATLGAVPAAAER